MYEVFTPLFAIAGAKDTALWMSSQTGLLTGSLILCLLVFIYIAVGMKWYARVQKICFWGGMVGLVLVFALLGFGTNETFVANLNSIAPAMFGTEQVDLYQATLEAGEAAGTVSAPLSSLVLGASMLLIPLITFQNLWPNWGSTLYGEVRGASDYKKNFWGMAAGVIVTAVLALIFFALIGKTLGWDFYNKANGAFWNYTWGYTEEAPPLPFWPYPVLFAAMLTKSPFLQFLVVLLMSLWWFGWSGTVFLSSTRVIFAAAFDRMLPEWVSNVEPRTRTPINALLLMVIPGMIVAALYSFNIFDFQSLALDSTLVIAVTFFGTTVAAIILPWKLKDVFDGSPIAKFKVGNGLSWLGLIAYGVTSVYLIYKSIQYGIAGAVNIAGTVSMLMYILVWILNVANAAVLLYLLYLVSKNLAADKDLPMIVFAGLIFLPFLDWLLVEWFWDPSFLYGIGWTNTSSMVFMLLNYGVAAAIFYGFNAYRRKQGIDVDKVYKEIPVE